MIKGFRSRDTQRLFETGRSRRFQGIARVALRKLDMLNAAVALTDLVAVPGNRLEALRGDRRGQHSIRINEQWRVCFIWVEDGPDNVEIVDYH